ncbi:MAG: universal stress protein [Rhodocyclaceae bacterium]|nr:universal stress protein [Rhodocyclaceae bacterium]
MLRMILPTDGSETSLRAVDHLVQRLDWYRGPVELHLINVQHPISGDVSQFVKRDDIRQYHQDEGLNALQPARARLDAAGVAYRVHIGVGEPASTIVRYAREQQIDQIVMGARGLGNIAGLLLGSTAIKVLHLAEGPVLLVK